jgi:hypothetical protein
MLQNTDNWLRWEQDGRRYVIDMDELAGVEFAPRTEERPAYVVLAVQGTTFTIEGDLAEQFMDWYWNGRGPLGYKVPDLDIP